MRRKSRNLKKLIVILFLSFNIYITTLQQEEFKFSKNNVENDNIITQKTLNIGSSGFSSNFLYFKHITIDHLKVSGPDDLINFPLLISIFDTDLHDYAQSDGNDIAFKFNDKWLDYELELYDHTFNSTHAQLIAWINIPLLSPSTNTIISMYYGNSTMLAQENPSNVWDSNYLGVWHLDEDGTGAVDEYMDSGNYNNHGQGGEGDSLFVPEQVGGQIGNAQDFNNLDGNYNYIDCGNNSIFDLSGFAITMEAWIKHDITPQDHMFGIMNHKGWYDGYRLFIARNSLKLGFSLPGDSYTLNSNIDVTTNIWHQVVAVYNGSWMSVYIDGVKEINVLAKSDAIEQSTSELDFWIGQGDQPENVAWSAEFEGQIDEVRLSNVSRNPSWIATQYNNQKDPSSFYSISGGNYIPRTNDFNYYKIITVNHAKINGVEDLTDFPVLISLIDSDLNDQTQSDGDDIAFALNDSWLDYEIEVFEKDYSPNNARMIAWVKIPSLSNSIDTEIFMYYGNSSINSIENPEGVWSNNYVNILHLNETPSGAVGEIKDSSASNNDGQTLGSMDSFDLIDGKIGNCYDLDGNDDMLKIPESPSLDDTNDAATFSLWINWQEGASSGRYQRIMTTSNKFYDAGGHWSGYEYAVQSDGDLFFYPHGDTDANYNLVSNPFTDQTWQYLVVTFNYTIRNASFYLDGNLLSPVIIGIPTNWNSLAALDDWLWGGAINRAGTNVGGFYDEIRVSTTDHTLEWIATEFNNQNDPSSFYSVGPAILNNIPSIKINAPNNYAIIPYTAPKFNITFSNIGTLDKMWYSLDGGFTNIEFINNGTINQAEWDKFGEELVTIRFYANNTDGDTSINDVIIRKKSISSYIDYSQYKIITVDNNMVEGSVDFVDFPFMISIFDEDLHNDVQPDADDIAFGNSSQWFNHEIEYFDQNYNQTHAKLVAWVRIPHLSTSSDTEIYMYYGNSTLDSEGYPLGVWSSNYKGIWHLNEDPGPGGADDIFDSTINNYDGTADSSMAAEDLISGKIGNSIEFDGSDDYISIGDTQEIIKTINFWMKGQALDGISSDTGFKSPSSFNDDYGQWAFPEYALTSDGQYARTPANDYQNDWYDFSFEIPEGIDGGVKIEGIEVKIEGNAQNMNTGVGVELSWDGGSTYTSTGYSNYWTGLSDYPFTFGGAIDNWGHDWTPSELINQNFRIKLRKIQSGGAGNMFYLDHLDIKIHYSVNEKIAEFNGYNWLEINQSNYNIIAMNFPSINNIYINGTVSNILDQNWNYVSISDINGIDISSLSLARTSNFYFNGTIDEFRILTNIPSSDWVLTEFNNQNNKSLFFTIGKEIKIFGDLEILCLDHDGFEILGLNVTLLNKTDNLIWQNYGNNSRTSDVFGFVTFPKLLTQDYTIKIYYGQKYGRQIELKELNISLTDDIFLIIDNLNLSRLQVKLEFQDLPGQPLYNALVSFYEDNGTNNPIYLGYETSDFYGIVNFYWLNQSTVNITFNVEKLGEPQLLNYSGLDTNNVSLILSDRISITVYVKIEDYTPFLNLEGNTELLMQNNYWGDNITINVTYGWEDELSISHHIIGADVNYQLIIEGSNIEIDSGNLPGNGSGGYSTSLNTLTLNMNASGYSYRMQMTAEKLGYDDIVKTIIIQLQNIPVSILPEDDIINFDIYWGENLTLNIRLNDTLHGIWVNDANITYEEVLLEISQGYLSNDYAKGDGWFNFTLDSSSFGTTGSYIFSMQLESDHYIADSVDIFIDILDIPMEITSENEIYDFDIYWLENLALNLRLEDTYNSNWINDAEIEYEEKFNSFISGNLTRDNIKGDGWYTFSFDSTDFPKYGTYTINIQASKENYVSDLSEIYINIKQIPTYLNGTLFLSVSYSLNVTSDFDLYFNYTDDNDNSINGANIEGWELQDLTNRDDILTGYIENSSIPGLYKLGGLNLSLFKIGTYSIIVRISKDNYIKRQAAISLVITPIVLEMIGIENFYNGPKGENITIAFRLINKMTGELMSNEVVKIQYNNSEYLMLVNQSSGEYYWTFDTNVYDVLGIAKTFETKIVVETNENFTASSYTLIIQVDSPLGWFGLPLIYWIIIGSVVALAVGIFTTARIVSYSKIPLVIKQINITSKSIKKDKKFRNIKITMNRKEIIEDHKKRAYGDSSFIADEKKIAKTQEQK